MKRQLLSIVDIFLSKEFSDKSGDQVYRERVLVSICLVMSALLILGTIIFVFFVNQDMFRRLLCAGILMPLAMLFIGICLLLRKTGKLELASQILIIIVLLSVIGGVSITGGPLYSSTSGTMVVPPLLAFCLLGKKNGLRWTYISFIAMSILCFIDGVMEVEFIHTANPATESLNRFFDWSLAFFIVVAVVFSYDHLATELKDNLANEKKRFEYQARHDHLTGLPNRNYFYERLERARKRSRRQDQAYGLMYIDLDGFKPINDKYGHDVGDVVLQVSAERMVSCVRETDTVARLGGDEFAVILEGLQDQQNMPLIAEKICQSVAEPIHLVDKDITLGASIGMAMSESPDQDYEEVIVNADKAMYKAKAEKKSGGNWLLYSGR